MFQTLEELAAYLKEEGYDAFIKTTTYESYHPGDLNLIIEVALCDQTISRKPSEELTRVSVINAPNIPKKFKEDSYDHAMELLNDKQE